MPLAIKIKAFSGFGLKLDAFAFVLLPPHFLPTSFPYICTISYGVPCRMDKLSYSAERKAEIIPVVLMSYRACRNMTIAPKPDPGNTGVGKRIQSQMVYGCIPAKIFLLRND